MYQFMFIEGINRTDTPLFNTLDQQKNWFDIKVVKAIDDNFPPHYTNIINLATDDISFLSKVNYVRLLYKNKYYYYFISNSSYINEDLISITLVMDTIQTYMFDIDYTYARISRKTIKRWNADNTINRNYLRENYSSDKMINHNYIDYSLQELKEKYFSGWIIFKTIDDILGQPNPTKLYKYNEEITDTVTTSSFMDGSRLYLLPMPYTDVGYNIKYRFGAPVGDGTFDVSVTKTSEDIINIINKLQQKPEILEIYYLPYETFLAPYLFNSSKENDNITIDIAIGDGTHFVDNNDGTFYISLEGTQITDLEDIYNINFNKNTVFGSPFKTEYVPQLIDENYIELKFGERMLTTEAPLSLYDKSTIHLKYDNDLFTGSRNYWVDNKTNGFDKYLTKITNNSPLMLPIINNEWKQYWAYHKGNVAMDSIKTIVGAMALFGNNPRPIRKNALTKKFIKQGTKYASETGDFLTDTVNKVLAPKTISQGGNITNDLLSKGCNRVVIENRCSNIDYVATIYESIGYAVDEFIVGNPLEQNRQIYNYIECADIDLTLNVLSTINAQEDIHDRYIDGIRFWNIDKMEQLNLKLGDICIYDNIEND